MTTARTADQTAQHTPGPWEIDERFDGRQVIRRTATTGQAQPFSIIADVQKRDYAIDECRANAALIASAPALLAALKAMQEHRCVGFGCYNAAHDTAHEAIRAAEGRTS